MHAEPVRAYLQCGWLLEIIQFRQQQIALVQIALERNGLCECRIDDGVVVDVVDIAGEFLLGQRRRRWQRIKRGLLLLWRLLLVGLLLLLLLGRQSYDASGDGFTRVGGSVVVCFDYATVGTDAGVVATVTRTVGANAVAGCRTGRAVVGIEAVAELVLLSDRGGRCVCGTAVGCDGGGGGVVGGCGVVGVGGDGGNGDGGHLLRARLGFPFTNG